MKKLLLITLFIYTCKITIAQCNWTPMGSKDSNQLSFVAAYYNSIAMDTNQTPYVVYASGVSPWKVTVKKFTGLNWDTVGYSNFSAGAALYTDIAIDNHNTPYVVYSDLANGAKASVMKFNGTAWVPVGAVGFSADTVSNINIVIDKNGTPYVGFCDHGHGRKATVMKFNGTTWVNIGNAGFSSWITQYNSIALDSIGTPYVAYRDVATTVMKFNGTTWDTVGTQNYAFGSTDISIVIAPNGTPYIGCNTNYTGWPSKYDVLMFNGTSWVHVCSTPAADSTCVGNDMTIDRNGNVYVAIADCRNLPTGGGLTVKKFNGTSWSIVGAAGFASGTGKSHSIVTDNNGVPYVVFSDGSISAKARVMKFNGTNWDVVGPSCFTFANAGGASIATDDNGVPYISYVDYSPYGIRVVKYNGSSWDQINLDSTFLNSATGQNSLAIYNNNPYLFFYNGTTQKVNLKKYNGTSWSSVGSPGFMTGYGVLAIDKNGTPYVGFNPNIGAKEATVVKFNGSTWDTVGVVGFSLGQIDYPALAFDANGTTYFAYSDFGPGSGWGGEPLTVMKFNGSAWVSLGSAGFTTGSASYGSIAISNNGTPYVAYADGAQFLKLTVMKFVNNSWVYVGSPGISPGKVSSTSISIDGNDNLYVSFIDATLNRPTLMSYNGTTWSVVGTANFSAFDITELAMTISGAACYVTYASTGLFAKQIMLNTSLSTAGTNSSCTGNSITLLAGGANTYSWSANAGGATTPVVVVTPTVTTSYTVTRTNSYGCVNVDTTTINITSNCVWPGDANEDLVVDNTDLLPIGLKFDKTGAARNNISDTWQGYACPDWNDTLSNGKNIKYTDCNGDSTINFNDTLAVNQNFNLTHIARYASSQIVQSTNPDIYVSFNKNLYHPGDTVFAYINIGSNANQQTNFYGSAFSINYDNTKAKHGTTKFYFNNSWVGRINQSEIKFSKLFTNTGVVDASLTRISHTDTTGFGKVATLQFILRDTISSNQLYFTVNNGIKTNHIGLYSNLNAGTDSVALSQGITSINKISQNILLNIYPNPAQNNFTIETNASEKQTLQVFDVNGKLVLTQTINGKASIDASILSEGVYNLSLINSNNVVNRRLVIVK